ncbi:Acyl-CoA-binding domain-containing protein 5 [Acipenser ruthenus]|uniref:Acyl-CoA-binding domain-containing protein 5 n=1 Tax=Acipenser ruthenus TaxID=7906 RepID=A0A444UUB2_ACIRT|nr:Acyl-CoA-binding domain-containing protein 5 [Acipenser ruthenus]
MGKVSFYVLWSLRDAPRQLISKFNRLGYQSQIPLPLPKQLVVFSLGDWRSYSRDTSITVEVSVSPDVTPQKIGRLSAETRCLVWEGEWRLDLLTAAMEQADRGVFGKLLLTVNGQVKTSFTSSTPVSSRKRLNMDCQSSSQQVETMTTLLFSGVHQLPKTPERTVLGRSKIPNLSAGDLSVMRSTIKDSPPSKKMCTLSVARSDEEKEVRFLNKATKSEKELVEKITEVCPNPRWGHRMCLSDPETAILIGGEGSEQKHCKDSLWKLEIDNDFWFPMDSSVSGPTPSCSRGHSATYDPESKRIYVFGGVKDGKRYSDIYMLNTLTWKWSLIPAKGKIPTLAYHSATIYKRELFVFGGIFPNLSPEGKAPSNALYIFNPEYEIWYQPIVEGEKPLPRFGHSATLLTNKLIIFGGKKTLAFLNDLHIMDLGFMEYTSVQYANSPPVPRGFHAAVPVSDNKVLISGGCSAIGALQDMHLFNLDNSTWSCITPSGLCSVPRAGHSMINLDVPRLTDAEKEKQPNGTFCMILMFGGSDCSGKFYNDTVKSILEI